MLTKGLPEAKKRKIGFLVKERVARYGGGWRPVVEDVTELIIFPQFWRKARVVVPDFLHHVVQRGVSRMDVFFSAKAMGQHGRVNPLNGNRKQPQK